MSSYSSVSQEDKSVQAAGDVGLLQGSGAQYSETNQSLANSLLISGNNQGEVIFNQFPEQVASSLKDLVGTVNTAVQTSAQTQLASTQALGEKLQSVATGEGSAVPKIALYGVIGLTVFLIATKVLK